MSKENTQVAKATKNISTIVLNKVNTFRESGELKMPQNYSPENALKSAYLVLQETKNKNGQSALTYCKQSSIADALLKMVVWGLSPLKKQCDFIMYGDKLECSIEYTGNIALAKRYGNLKRIKANCIYEGDTYKSGIDPLTGRKKVIEHTSKFGANTKKILGAYAVYELNDGTVDVEEMTIEQIRDAWNQGAMKGNSPAHKNFPDQMALKTVYNRACKLLIRTSDDTPLMDDFKETIDVTKENVVHEVSTRANQDVLDIDVEDAEVIEDVKKETEDEENERLMQEALEEEAKLEKAKEPGF